MLVGQLGITPADYCDVAAANMISLFRKARHEIVMVTGGTDRLPFDSPTLVSATRSALRRGVAVHVYAGPGADLESRFMTEFPEHIKILTQEPRMHFAVADRTHVRLEQVHAIADLTPPNLVLLDATTSAARLLSVLSASLREQSVAAVPLKEYKNREQHA